MGTLTAAKVIGRAARALNDPDMVAWTEAELLEFLSDAQRAAVLVRPEVNPVTKPLQLVAGTKQTLPDDAFVLIEATRNMGVDGTAPGRSVTPTSRASLDQTGSTWHLEDPDQDPDDIGVVTNFVYDIRNRKTFWVSPPQPEDNPHQLEIVIAKIPAEILAVATTLEVDDIYQPALLAYMLHRAHVKDVAIEGQGIQKSNTYFTWFMTLLLGKADEQEADLTIRHETGEKERTHARRSTA